MSGRVITPEKIEAYRKGKYVCPVPPVPTNLWSETAWILWIDRRGRWLI